MNDIELKKKFALDISIQCLQINTIGDERKREKGKPCVFFSLSGHVGSVDIGVYEKGWKTKCRPDRIFRLDTWSLLSDFADCLAYLNELYMGQTMAAEIEKNEDEDKEGKELSVDIDRAVGA